jgi:bifunctional UDP-N-acetylglucosamine pyrophosphorylase / glucosamine-1-phosphate N-acetyltransferase
MTSGRDKVEMKIGNLSVVILAAGQGKRMHSNLPKVLHPLAGKALVQHVIDTARTLSPDRLCLVYGHGGETVKAALAAPDIVFAEQAQQLGTGHAVQQAMPFVLADGVTLILYGDVPLISGGTLQKILQNAAGGLAVLTMELADPTGYGRIVRDAAGRVTGIVEHKDATPEERSIREVNTGIMAMQTQRLNAWLGELRSDNAQGEYYLTDIIGMAARDGVSIQTAHPQGEWEVLGVNSKVQLAELERAYQLLLAQEFLEQGVRLADPARLDVRGKLSCGRDVAIDVGCIFEGNVELAEGVTVGPYCVIRDAKIGAGARLAAFTHIDSAIVGPDCVVGPYARLRPGSELAAEAHIGNFVEVKNSQIGPQSKANHLAYVGDATVGARVNIGAGTITCNYDGANKFRTIIEDDVFIGSDTQLVAPVTVGRGATLGAGTTLTKDAPAEQLTVSRARQVSVATWKRPQKQVKK